MYPACYNKPIAGSPLGLALLERGSGAPGETSRFSGAGKIGRCAFGHPGFYYPKNERLHMRLRPRAVDRVALATRAPILGPREAHHLLECRRQSGVYFINSALTASVVAAALSRQWVRFSARRRRRRGAHPNRVLWQTPVRSLALPCPVEYMNRC